MRIVMYMCKKNLTFALEIETNKTRNYNRIK